MTTMTPYQRLMCLGWEAIGDGRRSDGSWYVLATSCGHVILVHANNRREAWRAVCSMALKLTREGCVTIDG
jgi:hypothetical protein